MVWNGIMSCNNICLLYVSDMLLTFRYSLGIENLQNYPKMKIFFEINNIYNKNKSLKHI